MGGGEEGSRRAAATLCTIKPCTPCPPRQPRSPLTSRCLLVATPALPAHFTRAATPSPHPTPPPPRPTPTCPLTCRRMSWTTPTSVLMSTWRRMERSVSTSIWGSRWIPTHTPAGRAEGRGGRVVRGWHRLLRWPCWLCQPSFCLPPCPQGCSTAPKRRHSEPLLKYAAPALLQHRHPELQRPSPASSPLPRPAARALPAPHRSSPPSSPPRAPSRPPTVDEDLGGLGDDGGRNLLQVLSAPLLGAGWAGQKHFRAGQGRAGGDEGNALLHLLLTSW